SSTVGLNTRDREVEEIVTSTRQRTDTMEGRDTRGRADWAGRAEGWAGELAAEPTRASRAGLRCTTNTQRCARAMQSDRQPASFHHNPSLHLLAQLHPPWPTACRP